MTESKKLLRCWVGSSLLVLLVVGTAHAAGGGAARSYAAGSFLLQLDGVDIGFCKSVEGGTAVADVVTETKGAGAFPKKHVGNVRYEDLQLELGFDAAAPVYQWIADTWDAKPSRKNGAVVTGDFNYKAKERTTFSDALLTSVTVPKLDAASKDSAALELGITPQLTRTEDGKDESMAATQSTKSKAFLAKDFRLELDGIDTSKVSKIEAFTVKQTVAASNVGEQRDAQKEPGKLEFPNLIVTVAAAGADGFQAWLEDFVIKGNASDDKEKSGAIVLLASDLKTEVARIALSNVGIVRVAPLKREANADAVASTTVELYVERMRFSTPSTSKPASSAKKLDAVEKRAR